MERLAQPGVLGKKKLEPRQGRKKAQRGSTTPMFCFCHNIYNWKLELTMKCIFFTFIFFCLCFIPSYAADKEIFLRNNLTKAHSGDYLVTAQNKNYTMLIIRSKDDRQLAIDEITLPMARKSGDKNFSWKQWVGNGAPGNTAWIMYSINLPNGCIQNTFSFTRNEWITIPRSQNFLSTLLNLRLQPIPANERKKVGPPPASDSIDRRPIWQPQMIVDGIHIKGVIFDGWRTRWPKDDSELSDRVIEVFLPKDSERYPAYFPYWLQINGMIGKAKVRIIDSGNNLSSPARLPQSQAL